MKYYDGDVITRHGLRFRIRIERDQDYREPWKEMDGCGPVSGWTHRPKAPGEMVLCREHGSYRYYDYREAVKMARRDGWGCEGKYPTRRARAAAAAMLDYRLMKRWVENDWWWCFVSVIPYAANGKLNHDLAVELGGVSSDDTDSFVDELIDEVVYNRNLGLSLRAVDPWEAIGDAPDLIRLTAVIAA